MMPITGMIFRNPETGITTRVSIPGGRRHLAVMPIGFGGGEWGLQWATSDCRGGHHYEAPIERGFKTKREAEKRKREIRGW